jgi:tetratricopeptide (TPR) repeat protein
MNENTNFLYQANSKLIDALNLKTGDNHYYYQTGRSFCLIGRYEEAIIYLKPCLNYWPENEELMILARYYNKNLTN